MRNERGRVAIEIYGYTNTFEVKDMLKYVDCELHYHLAVYLLYVYLKSQHKHFIINFYLVPHTIIFDSDKFIYVSYVCSDHRTTVVR